MIRLSHFSVCFVVPLQMLEVRCHVFVVWSGLSNDMGKLVHFVVWALYLYLYIEKYLWFLQIVYAARCSF